MFLNIKEKDYFIMGYTHYLNDIRDIKAAEWKLLQEITHLLFLNSQKRKIDLCNGFGDEFTFPIINDEYISFNGLGDLSHESCYITKKVDGDFSFCKTNRKPYDIYIVAFYYILEKLDIAKMSSDGFPDELKAGKALARRIMAKTIHI